MAKVALYHPWIYLKGGAERFIYEVITSSRHEWKIITNHFDKENTFDEFSTLDVIEINRVSVRRNFFSSGIGALKILTQRLPLEDVDVLLISSEGLGDLVGLRNNAKPIMAYCHTPLKVVHDEQTKERWMETHGEISRFLFKFFTGIFNIVDRHAWKRFDKVLCNSKEVQRRIFNAGLYKGKSKVIHPGVSSKFFNEYLPNTSEKYFLIAGRIMWTKNIELGIKAFIHSNLSIKGYKLKIAGMVDEKSGSYLEFLKRISEGEEEIDFVINPSDKELLQLYQNSVAILFTPPNEDFGIAVVEGMAVGKVVIATARGGPVEILENGETGILCKDTPEEFAIAMNMVVEDKELSRKISLQAKVAAEKYSWKHCVAQIDAEIDTLL
ncbi:glycosyltransferase [Cohnella xylanilytica]|uniref:GDP-Man:Man(1)GlcNAc(2)-PP-Dol alpha-1,3-mannosyltransferase n=1 Tax=Cohnella xylanilytica TaxID=557555 RepID=A0A841U1D6_9BACL|nr:glycosyltransferase [Cohnella xylanilytica]MBB6693252.1 glycosyltransferase [Cohnella xylanilytica]